MRKKGLLYILGAGCLWGSATLFTNIMFEAGASFLQVSGVRALVACVFYWVIGYMNIGMGILCQPKDIVKLILSGAASVGTMYLTYTLSLYLLDVSLAVVFLYTAPVYVAIYMCVSGREKVSMLQMLGIVLIVAGTMVSATDTKGTIQISRWGIVAGIICGVSYALVTIFRKTIQATYSAFQVTAYTSLGAVLALLPFLDIGSLPINGKTGICFLGNGILSTALPQLLYIRGLDFGVSGATGSCLAAVELIVAGVCGVFVLGEPTSQIKVVGLVVVFLGVIMSARKKA